MHPRRQLATHTRTALLLLAAGLGVPHPGMAAPQGQPDTQDATGILERIRQDVGNYELQAASWRGDVKPQTTDPAMPTDPAFVIACPRSVANDDFDITRIELTLQVLAQDTTTAQPGLQVALNGAGASRQAAQSHTKTIVLDRIPDYDPAELSQFRAGIG